MGQLQTNCYLLVKNKECILIDPADDASFLLEEISRQNVSLVGMLATHGHFDHVMATGEIQLSLKIPLYIHAKDIFLIERLGETAKYFLGYEPHVIQPTILRNLQEGEFQIKNFKFKITSTPGHTPGGCSFYFFDEQAVFTGDTLFRKGIGRTDLSYSNEQDLQKSLQKIFALPEETVVYPGHGEETVIMNEK